MDRYLIGTFLMLFASGSVYGFTFHAIFVVYAFLFYSVYLYSKRKIRCRNSRNIAILSIIVSYLCFNYFIINNNHPTPPNQIIVNVSFAIGAFFFISSVSYDRFKQCILKSVSILAGLSVIVFFAVQTRLLPIELIAKGTKIYTMSLFHCVGWEGGIFDRLAGIYWEPGAYQIVLNLVLLLFLSDFVQGNLHKIDRYRLIIILVASILTRSTAGYLVLGLLSIAYMYLRVKYVKKTNIWKLALVGIIVFSSISYLLNSDVVTNKLAQQGTQDTSYEIRAADNLAMVTMITNRPIFGYGLDTREGATINMLLDNKTSSNGILANCSTWGVPYVLFLLLLVYMNIKKMNTNLPVIVVFFFYLIINTFEVFLHYPLMYMFIFTFIPTVKHANTDLQPNTRGTLR